MDFFNKEKISELYPEAENLMFPSMLIWKLPQGKENMLSEVCSNGKYFLQEKIDGAFYQFVKTENYSYLFGRTISKTSGLLTEKSANVPHIKEALSGLPAKTILIGEIYVPDGTSKDTVSIMGCLPTLAVKRQKDNPIHYYVHDIIYYNGVNLMDECAEGRYNILETIWKRHGLDQYPFLRLASKIDENLEEEISKILKSGGEGVVLKKKDYPYIPDKRPAWSTIKVKKMDSVDLVCIGFCPPTKEYTGKEIETWQYWEAKESQIQGIVKRIEGNMYGNPNYIPVTKYYYFGFPSAIEVGAYDEKGNIKFLGTVSSGLSDEDKQKMAEKPKDYLYKVISLDCMSISHESMTLRHPVFKCFREDKNPKDCKISDIFG